jgi:hypothetical protein
MPKPTLGQLAKTAARLQARQPTASFMFGRGDHAGQAEAPIKELKRAPPAGSVTTGITATRIVQPKPKGQ